MSPRLGEAHGDSVGEGANSEMSRLGDTGRKWPVGVSESLMLGERKPQRAAGALSTREGLTVPRRCLVNMVVANPRTCQPRLSGPPANGEGGSQLHCVPQEVRFNELDTPVPLGCVSFESMFDEPDSCIFTRAHSRCVSPSVEFPWKFHGNSTFISRQFLCNLHAKAVAHGCVTGLLRDYTGINDN